MRIYINPGHGGGDPGATNGGRQEKDDALRYARDVANILKQSGQTVKLERDGDYKIDVSNIASKANEWKADLFIAFHRNSGGGTGAECLISSKSASGSNQLAQSIQNALIKVGFNNRGVKIQDTRTTVLQKTTMPATTIEAGFIDNATDNSIFDSRYQDMVKGIAQAILDIAGGKMPDNVTIGEYQDQALSGPNDIASLAALFGDVNPYVILPDKNLKMDNISAEKLKDAQVSGFMLYGGQVYSNLHPNAAINVPSISPHLGLQVEYCEKNDFYYGLVFNSMVCTEEQLNKDIKEIIKTVQLYSPALGVWLTIDWDKGKKEENDKYLEKYQKYFVKYGLKDKIGLYVSREQLSAINWDKHKNDWYLWLIDYVTSDTDLEDFAFSWDFFYLDPDKEESQSNSQSSTSAVSTLVNEVMNQSIADELDKSKYDSYYFNKYMGYTETSSSSTSTKVTTKSSKPTNTTNKGSSSIQQLVNESLNTVVSQQYSNDKTSTRKNLLLTLIEINNDSKKDVVLRTYINTDAKREQMVDRLISVYGNYRLQSIASNKDKIRDCVSSIISGTVR